MSDASTVDVGSGIEATGQPQKRKLDPGFSRNIKIIGGALGIAVLALVLILFSRSGGDSTQAVKSEMQISAGNVQASGAVTPAMEDMLRKQQLIESAEAARRGLSYIPPDSVGALEPVEQPQIMPPQALPPTAYQQASIQRQQGQLSESDQRRREGLENQLAAMLAGSAATGGSRARVSAEKSEEKGGSASAAPSAGASGAAPGQQTPARQILPGLEIVAATLSSDLNVPAGGAVYASATVRSGVLNGAFLVGSARVVDESLEINFTQMRFGEKLYPIDAIVLDQQTASNAIAGGVDRRILQRYVLPIALATAQGFFSAKSNPGSVVVNVGQDAGVATPPSTSEQARSAGVSAGLEIAGQTVQQEAQAPIIVSAPRNTSVGLLFRAPVLEGATK